MPPDNKEHHFCFAYEGEKMEQAQFESLKFLHVQGTSTADGTQLVRISLQRRNGRRAGTIPRIIEQYNKTAAAPITVFKHPVTCFKLTQKPSENPILLRIELDKQTSRYWTWSSQTSPVTKKPAAPTKQLALCVEQMVRDLKMDPSAMCVKSICGEIQAQYHEAHGGCIDDPISAEQRAFILKELHRYLQREKLYIVSPVARSRQLDHHAHAIIRPDSLMDDLKFKDDGDTKAREGPNDTILRYLKSMIGRWEGRATVRLTSMEIVDALNSQHAGLYRHTCVASFMQPFIRDGSVETSDNTHFTLDVARIAQTIK